eukprot:NODE_67_length_23829_cov_0.557059.p17 type:complete len:135 gc:universal NODE_67_length_23829_cov_0.557059:5893-6297(+)
MYSSHALKLMEKYTNKDNRKVKKLSKKGGAKEIVENSKLGKQIFFGKKLNTLGLGQIDDESFDFLADALRKKDANPLYGKFVKHDESLKNIPSIEKLEEFSYLSGKGGVCKSSAKLLRMEALYAKDKAEEETKK